MSEEHNEDERATLLGDRQAAVRVVSALRKYRQAAKDLLEKSRGGGGGAYPNDMWTFESEVNEAEKDIANDT